LQSALCYIKHRQINSQRYQQSLQYVICSMCMFGNWCPSHHTDPEACSGLHTAAAAAKLAGMTGRAAYWAGPAVK